MWHTSCNDVNKPCTEWLTSLIPSLTSLPLFIHAPLLLLSFALFRFPSHTQFILTQHPSWPSRLPCAEDSSNQPIKITPMVSQSLRPHYVLSQTGKGLRRQHVETHVTYYHDMCKCVSVCMCVCVLVWGVFTKTHWSLSLPLCNNQSLWSPPSSYTHWAKQAHTDWYSDL